MQNDLQQLRNMCGTHAAAIKKIDAYSEIALYAMVVGSVKLVVGAKARMVTGWSKLLALFTANIMKQVKLQPRPSDIETNVMMEALEDTPSCTTPHTDQQNQHNTSSTTF